MGVIVGVSVKTRNSLYADDYMLIKTCILFKFEENVGFMCKLGSKLVLHTTCRFYPILGI